MTEAIVRIPPKLKPVFLGPADVRGAYGGRGSAKTRSFAKMAAVQGYRYGQQGVSGIILCARQYMNSLADSSLEEIKWAIQDEEFLSDYYDVGTNYIKSNDGRIVFTFAGLDRSIQSIKSKGRILLCWVDEAEPVTEEALRVLVPTLREEGDDWNAELWITWNPKRRNAAVDARYRSTDDKLIKIVQLNWRDNAKFPARLERERQRDLKDRPEQYAHVWEGEFVSVIEGAYWAAAINQAKKDGRISRVAADPLMKYHLAFDIGGTGARADAVSIWAAQLIGKEIRAVKYYEAVGQPLATHIAWMREQGYEPSNTQIWLPHDGDTNDKVYDVSYASALKKAGYKVKVVPNQGKGAAKKRIEIVRQMFPSCWFDEEGTKAGIEALGWYHEKIDDERQIGLGPEHDWASHGADAFGLLCIAATKVQKEGDSIEDPYAAFGKTWAG